MNIDHTEILRPGIFTKSAIVTISFMVFTPITLALSLYALFSISGNPHSSAVLAAQVPATPPILAPQENQLASIDGQADSTDARAEIVNNYLQTYNSPLEPYSKLIVQTADRHALDFRLITAIAQQESNLCKVIPEGTYNCWGWGIHSEGTLGFDSYEDGIETVSRGIKQEYIDKGYTTPNQIMTKYTPGSNGSWAAGVNAFMEQMQ
jgi:hypothetical protein